jgi:transcriptional regulator with XRE-family HTH domain
MEGPTREDVDAATAAIGVRLANLRSARRMRVSELARKAGVSSSLISQIERGSSKPSVGTLFAVAQVLGVPVDTFFSDVDTSAEVAANDAPAPMASAAPPLLAGPNGAPPSPLTDEIHRSWRGDSDAAREVVRHSERSSLEIRGGVRWERLTPTPLDGIEFLELVYSPGAESDGQAYRHPGIELVVVTQGTMTIFLGFTQHDLGPGDSIAFPSSTPHRYVNLTDGETRAMTVILRDDLSKMQIRDVPDPTRIPGDAKFDPTILG